MANISITTITAWAGFEYSDEALQSKEVYQSNYCALPNRVIGAVRAYSRQADSYIESKGKSTMIRVFAPQATGSDKKVLEEAHEAAKDFTVYHFNQLVNEHDESYSAYLAGKRTLEFRDSETEPEEIIEAKDAIEKFERIGEGKYYHLRKGSLAKYTHLVEIGVL